MDFKTTAVDLKTNGNDVGISLSFEGQCEKLEAKAASGDRSVRLTV